MLSLCAGQQRSPLLDEPLPIAAEQPTVNTATTSERATETEIEDSSAAPLRHRVRQQQRGRGRGRGAARTGARGGVGSAQVVVDSSVAESTAAGVSDSEPALLPSSTRDSLTTAATDDAVNVDVDAPLSTVQTQQQQSPAQSQSQSQPRKPRKHKRSKRQQQHKTALTDAEADVADKDRNGDDEQTTAPTTATEEVPADTRVRMLLELIPSATRAAVEEAIDRSEGDLDLAATYLVDQQLGVAEHTEAEQPAAETETAAESPKTSVVGRKADKADATATRTAKADAKTESKHKPIATQKAGTSHVDSEKAKDKPKSRPLSLPPPVFEYSAPVDKVCCRFLFLNPTETCVVCV